MSMSQSAYLKSHSVPDLPALQAVIDALGFDCKLDESYTPFQSSGFLPCKLNGDLTGFEIYFDRSANGFEGVPDSVVGGRDAAITFRWGGYMEECACVLIVSAALAKSFDAVVYYADDAQVFSAEQLVQQAHGALEDIQ